jgi:hypothetical protein
VVKDDKQIFYFFWTVLVLRCLKVFMQLFVIVIQKSITLLIVVLPLLSVMISILLENWLWEVNLVQSYIR